MTIRTAATVLALKKPSIIRIAQTKMGTCPSLWSLGALHVRALQVLAHFTPEKSPRAPLFVKRSDLAATLGRSERTIDRIVSKLCAEAVITRTGQQRLGVGQWGVMRIQWSESSISKYFPHLAFEESVATSSAALPVHDGRDGRDRLKAGMGNSTARATSLAHKSTSSSLREEVLKNKPVRAPFQKPSSPALRRLPVDLHPLVTEFCLTREQVVVLMGKCKAKSTRLQDVLAIAAEAMREASLTGREAMAWLCSVVASGRDFAWARKIAVKKVVQAARPARITQLENRVVEAIRKAPRPLPHGATAMKIENGVVTVIPGGSGGAGVPRYIPVRVLLSELAKTSPMAIRQLVRGIRQPGEDRTHPKPEEQLLAPGQDFGRNGDLSEKDRVKGREQTAALFSLIKMGMSRSSDRVHGPKIAGAR